MTEPKKDVKVWLRVPIHGALKKYCATLPGDPSMGQYIDRLVERDMGSKAMDAIVLEEAFREAGIDREAAERALRRGENSGFGGLGGAER